MVQRQTSSAKQAHQEVTLYLDESEHEINQRAIQILNGIAPRIVYLKGNGDIITPELVTSLHTLRGMDQIQYFIDHSWMHSQRP